MKWLLTYFLNATRIRTLHLLLALIANYLSFGLLWLKRFTYVSLSDRAIWMHHACRRVARALSLSLELSGHTAASGLITSNHLSYLDILTFATASPCIFVSKSDVQAWPIIGTLARFGGTIFVDRKRRTTVDAATIQIGAALSSGLPIVLFPEGTSTDGSLVLPFHSSLLEPAVRCNVPLTAAAIGYSSPSYPESAFCYYGDVRFTDHLMQMLRVPHTRMLLRFEAKPQRFSNSKQAAHLLREKTLAMRATLHLEPGLQPALS